MKVKKILLAIFGLIPLMLLAQKPDTKAQRRAERNERIRQLQQRAEEGAIVFNNQLAFALKLNTDGYGGFLEYGRMKSMNTTNLLWGEIGERKHPKEEKLSRIGVGFSNPFVYGKINNFYYAKAGYGQQRLLGNKGNKNGVAVTAIYGGGFSAGFLKPYYIEIIDPVTGKNRDIKYSNNADVFLESSGIIGASGFGKGVKESEFVPGAFIRTAARFDYGRYNDMLSALEVGLNAEIYSKKMPIMLLNKEKRFFFNAYVALVFGRRR